MPRYRIYDTNAGYCHYEDEAPTPQDAVAAWLDDMNTSADEVELEIRVVELTQETKADGSKITVAIEVDHT